MVSTVNPTQTKAWAKSVLHTAQGFGPTPLSVISGEIPPGLRGSLYRNGPARLERGGQHAGHWFDGDGAILGLHFTDAGAIGVYRYVQTAGYQEEEAAGKFLFANYGMLPPGSLWQRIGKPVKNAANTSVLALPDRLLALWEGGLPHALTLDTLETIGTDDLSGVLKGKTYSAHAKRDPKTGDIFNFGVVLGAPTTLHLYRSDASGQIQQQNQVALDKLPILHDFAFADRYLIFCISPVRMQLLPTLLYLKSYSEALLWQPEQGTEILVVDRATLEVVSRSQVEAWYQWHFANAYTDTDGSVVVSLVRFPDFQTNQNLKEVGFGAITTPAKGTLWELRLDPQSGQVLELREVMNRGCEFPTVHPQDVGQSWRYTYLSVRRQASAADDQELFGAIARFDHHSGTLLEADAGVNCYPSEPIYAPDADDPEQGWILTVVYDGNTNTSEAWIYQADRLEEPPVCRLALPEVIPLGFHGIWQPAAQKQSGN